MKGSFKRRAHPVASVIVTLPAPSPRKVPPALVAQGLGTDHGDFDLAAAEWFAAETPTR